MRRNALRGDRLPRGALAGGDGLTRGNLTRGNLAGDELARGTLTGRGLTGRGLGRQRLTCAGGAGHAFSGRKTLSGDTLCGNPLSRNTLSGYALVGHGGLTGRHLTLSDLFLGELVRCGLPGNGCALSRLTRYRLTRYRLTRCDVRGQAELPGRVLPRRVLRGSGDALPLGRRHRHHGRDRRVLRHDRLTGRHLDPVHGRTRRGDRNPGRNPGLSRLSSGRHRLPGQRRRLSCRIPLSCRRALRGDGSPLGDAGLRHARLDRRSLPGGCLRRGALGGYLLHGRPGGLRLRLRSLADRPPTAARGRVRGMRLRRRVVVGLAVRHGVVPPVAGTGVRGNTLTRNLHLPRSLSRNLSRSRDLSRSRSRRSRLPRRRARRAVRLGGRQGEHRTGTRLLRGRALRGGGQRPPTPSGGLLRILGGAGRPGTPGRIGGGHGGQRRRQRVLLPEIGRAHV